MKSSEVREAIESNIPPNERRSAVMASDPKSGVGGVIVEGLSTDPKEVSFRQRGVGEPG